MQMTKISDQNLLVAIGEAAELLGVSVSTLRRMDGEGIIGSVRTTLRGKRYFFKTDLLNLKFDGYMRAKEWVKLGKPPVPSKKKFKDFYFPKEPVLNGKVAIGAHLALEGLFADDYIGVIISATMELVGNAFYHNRGQWPDLEGAFYVLDRTGKRIIVADRGVGLLKNLKLVENGLRTHAEALLIAFTKQISSRLGEGHRGFGLKFTRKCVEEGYLKRIVFQTGDARLEIRAGDKKLYIDTVSSPIQGCLAVIEF